MDCAHSLLCAASTPTTSACTATRLSRRCRSRRHQPRWRNFTTRPSASPETSLNGSIRRQRPRQKQRGCIPNPTPTPADRSKQVCSDGRPRSSFAAAQADTIRYRVLGCRPFECRRVGLEIDGAHMAGRLHGGEWRHSATRRNRMDLSSRRRRVTAHRPRSCEGDGPGRSTHHRGDSRRSRRRRLAGSKAAGDDIDQQRHGCRVSCLGGSVNPRHLGGCVEAAAVDSRFTGPALRRRDQGGITAAGRD